MLNDSYEVQNWARLSPRFRDAHNRRRIAHGMEPLPQPEKDLYKPPSLTDEDRKRFNIPRSGIKLDAVPADMMPPPLEPGEGSKDRRR